MAFGDNLPMINGTVYSWSSIQCLIVAGGVPVPLLGINSIRYETRREKAHNYAVGGNPYGVSYGNITRTAMIRVYKEEIDALVASTVDLYGDIHTIPPFDIVIQYEESGAINTVKLINCEFLNNGSDVSQGDPSMLTELELSVGNIKYK